MLSNGWIMDDIVVSDSGEIQARVDLHGKISQKDSFCRIMWTCVSNKQRNCIALSSGGERRKGNVTRCYSMQRNSIAKQCDVTEWRGNV